MNYEEFLQTPHTFMNDVVEILTIKKKWGVSTYKRRKDASKTHSHPYPTEFL